MRGFLKIGGLVFVGLAAVVALLVATPLGLRLGATYLIGMVEGDTGLRIDVGSLRGSLLSGVAVRDASVSLEDGLVLATVDSADVRYDVGALALRREVRGRVYLEGASVLLEKSGSGLLGWDAFGSDGEAEADTSDTGGMPILVELSARDLAITYRDTAAGVQVVADDLAIDGSWSGGPYDARLACSLGLAARGLTAPLGVSLEAAVSGTAERHELSHVTLESDAFTVGGSGELEVSEDGVVAVAASATSTISLDETLGLIDPELVAAPDVGGTLEVGAELGGRVDSLAYRVRASSDEIDIAPTKEWPVGEDVHLRNLELDLSGVGVDVVLDSLSLDTFGGSLSASGHVAMRPEEGERPSLEYRGRVRLEEMSLADISRAMPRRASPASAEVEGELSLAADIRGRGASIEGVSGSLGLSIAGLTVDRMALGHLAAEGVFEDRVAVMSARCCSTVVEGSVSLDERGVERADAAATISDLSVLARAMGVEDLDGEGVISLEAARPGSILIVSADAEFPSLSYRHVDAAPLNAAVGGHGDEWSGWFAAFDGALMGQVTTSGGGYVASLAADRMDMTSVVPDSVSETFGLSGAVSARFSVGGDTSGFRSAEGTVSALDVSARGERMTLERPFQFAAAPDSVGISRAALSTTFGGLSFHGSLGHGSGRISADFSEIDLAVIDRASERGLPAPLAGTMNGSLDLTGELDDPRFVADIVLSGVSYAGVGFESIYVEAENDSTDMVFYLDAMSGASGNLTVSGSVPVRSDSLRPIALAGDRGFGVSLAASDLALDVQRWGVRSLGGLRRIELDGSMLLTGRADSLSSLRGRGGFGTLVADLGLVEVSLRDTMEFDLAGGRVEFAETTLGVARRRVLGDERGGSVRFSGFIARDRSVEMSVRVDSLSVAHLVRAVTDRPVSPVAGRLDLEAKVFGDVADPAFEADWRLSRPSLGGFRFDGVEGALSMSDGVLTVERTRLIVGESAIEASGTLSLGSGEEGGAPGSVDMSVTADDFRLEGVRPELPNLRSLGGGVDVDLRATGPLDAPRLDGRMALSDGSVRGFGLSEQIEGIQATVVAGGSVLSLERAVVPMGEGEVRASGFVGLSDDGPPAFRLRVRLDDPEVALKDLLEARFSGSVVWTGTTERSQLDGDVNVDRLDVVYEVSFAELLTRRASRIAVRMPAERGPEVLLDVDIGLTEPAKIESNVASLSLEGGFHVGGTTEEHRFSGSVYAGEGGTLTYLDHEFAIETLTVVYSDPRRAYPEIDLMGTTHAADRAGQEYEITLRFAGFADQAVPQFTSSPPLSQPDIIALLTFGDTVGMLVSGEQRTGSSGDSFHDIAQRAFLSNAFGIAEASLERWLNLDTVKLDDDAVARGELSEADITIGKQIGSRISVNYTTQVGSFRDQAVEVLLRLTKRLSIGTRADPEGNHAINLRLRAPFE